MKQFLEHQLENIMKANSQQSPSHTYSVALRFYGETLNFDEISAKLNLQPSYGLSQADIDNQTSVLKRTPHWNFNGKGFDGFCDEWQDLEQGLVFLTTILQPQRDGIVELSRQVKAVWWIGHFQNSFDGGYTLSAKLMNTLGEFQIPMCVDNYFSAQWAE